MIKPVDVQASIISLLKAQGPVVAIVGNEIREDSWMGHRFLYPAVRVEVPTIRPAAGQNGTCYYATNDVDFNVYCYAEDSSSKPAVTLTGLVEQGLWGKALPGFTTIVRVLLVNILMPVQEGERMWRAQVQCRTTIKEA